MINEDQFLTFGVRESARGNVYATCDALRQGAAIDRRANGLSFKATSKSKATLDLVKTWVNAHNLSGRTLYDKSDMPEWLRSHFIGLGVRVEASTNSFRRRRKGTPTGRESLQPDNIAIDALDAAIEAVQPDAAPKPKRKPKAEPVAQPVAPAPAPMTEALGRSASTWREVANIAASVADAQESAIAKISSLIGSL